MFASLFHMGQSRVCSLIITIKELQHWLHVTASLIRLIWTVLRLKKNPPGVQLWASVVLLHIRASAEVFLVCYTAV